MSVPEAGIPNFRIVYISIHNYVVVVVVGDGGGGGVVFLFFVFLFWLFFVFVCFVFRKKRKILHQILSYTAILLTSGLCIVFCSLTQCLTLVYPEWGQKSEFLAS